MLVGGGCAHVDHARADYHEEEHKANRADRDAEHDPLP
jgi:hypothetical protein